VVAGAAVVVVVAGAAVVVVVAGAAVVVVVAGAAVVVAGAAVVVAGALRSLVFTLVVVVTRCQDRWLRGFALEVPLTAAELTVAPEVLLTAEELASTASVTATTIPPAKVRRRRIGEAP
jgi:hypothetical protein